MVIGIEIGRKVRGCGLVCLGSPRRGGRYEEVIELDYRRSSLAPGFESPILSYPIQAPRGARPRRTGSSRVVPAAFWLAEARWVWRGGMGRGGEKEGEREVG